MDSASEAAEVSVTWEFTGDPAEFLASAGSYLAARPVVATIVATVAERAAAGELTPAPGVPFWFAHACDGTGDVVGVAVRTAPFPPYPVLLLPMPEAAAVDLAASLHARDEHPGGANGVLPATQVFANTAAALFDGRVEATVETLLHELGELEEPETPSGAASRPARVTWTWCWRGSGPSTAPPTSRPAAPAATTAPPTSTPTRR